MSQVTKTFTEHPQNSIILMNGAVLECIPKESHQGDFVPDQMKLDTTGVYLSIGNKQIKDLEFKVCMKKHELINQFLPEGISYNEMERYMNKKNEI